MAKRAVDPRDLFWLAQDLRRAGARLRMLLGAEHEATTHVRDAWVSATTAGLALRPGATYTEAVAEMKRARETWDPPPGQLVLDEVE